MTVEVIALILGIGIPLVGLLIAFIKMVFSLGRIREVVETQGEQMAYFDEKNDMAHKRIEDNVMNCSVIITKQGNKIAEINGYQRGIHAVLDAALVQREVTKEK